MAGYPAPFDDGNGRLSRAGSDMALARAEGTHQRFYSFSAQIQHERKGYYDHLEATPKGPLDMTPWLHWFLGCLLRAMQGADATLAGVLDKAQFWQRWAGTPMKARQTLVLNRVLDGMEGKLTNAKWAAIAKCSPETGAAGHQRPVNPGCAGAAGRWRAEYRLHLGQIGRRRLKHKRQKLSKS